VVSEPVSTVFRWVPSSRLGSAAETFDCACEMNRELLVIDATLSVADAFGQLLRNALGHWQVNQPAALANQDEGVHQVRVAIRRVKSLFDLFRPYIAKADYDAVRGELTRIGRTLGAARDWDVFVDETLARAATRRSTHGAARNVVALAQPMRRRCHRQMVEMINAPPYAAFLLQMSRRLDERRWLGGMKRNRSAAIADASPDLLDRQPRAAFKAGRGIAGLSAGQRHELRKKLKKLCYSVEFVADLHGERVARRYSNRLNRVLDVLGDLNDLAMAEKCLVEASAGTGKVKRVVAPLRKRWRRQRAKRLDQLPGVWRRFRKTERFWTDGPAA